MTQDLHAPPPERSLPPGHVSARREHLLRELRGARDRPARALLRPRHALLAAAVAIVAVVVAPAFGMGHWLFGRLDSDPRLPGILGNRVQKLLSVPTPAGEASLWVGPTQASGRCVFLHIGATAGGSGAADAERRLAVRHRSKRAADASDRHRPDLVSGQRHVHAVARRACRPGLRDREGHAGVGHADEAAGAREGILPHESRRCGARAAPDERRALHPRGLRRPRSRGESRRSRAAGRKRRSMRRASSRRASGRARARR